MNELELHVSAWMRLRNVSRWQKTLHTVSKHAKRLRIVECPGGVAA